jgi:hypothetical protein
MLGKSTSFLVYAIIYLVTAILAAIFWQFSIHILWDWVYMGFIIVMSGVSFISFYMYYGRGILFKDKEMVVRNFKTKKIPYKDIECVDVYPKDSKYSKKYKYDFRIVTKDEDVIYLTELGDTILILEGFKTRFSSKVIMHEYSIMFTKSRRKR